MDSQMIAQRAIESTHTQVFFVAAMMCLILAVIPHGNRRGLSWQRKVYWTGVFSAATCAFIAGLPNLTAAIAVASLCVFVFTARAYFFTQYIKICGRVIAFHGAKEMPAKDFGVGADPYSPRVSAAKLWWLLVFCTIIGSVNVLGYVIDGDGPAYGLLGLGILIVTGALFGFGDGMHGQRVARGQYLPFGIVAVISVGISTVCYLIAHAAGLRFRR